MAAANEVKGPEDWGVKEASEKIAALKPADFDENRLYIEERDHWQERKGYAGPIPDEGPTADTEWAEIKAGFVPRDAVGKCTGRKVDGLLKLSPQVKFTPARPMEDGEEPTPEEAKLIAEATQLHNTWSRNTGLVEKVKRAVRASSWAATVGAPDEGRGFLRLWAPSGLLEDSPDGDGTKVVADPTGAAPEMARALAMVHVSTPFADRVAIYTDPLTQRRVGLYVDGDTAEIAYVDPADGMTLVRKVTKEGAAAVTVDMGGLLPIIQVSGRVVLDTVVRANQRALNFFNSALCRLVQQHSHRGMMLSNADPVGEWTKVPPGKEPNPGWVSIERADGLWQLKPGARVVGNSWVTEVQGRFTQAPGAKDTDTGTLANPGIHEINPADPDAAIKASDHARRVILEAYSQEWTLGSKETGSSGEEKRQSRADYEADLLSAKDPVEDAYAQTVRAAFALGEHFAKQVGRYTARLQVSVNLHVDPGPPVQLEVDTNQKQVESGLMSRETAMARNRIEDPEGEMRRIQADPKAELESNAKRIEMLASLRLTFPYGDPVDLAVAAGWPEQEAQKKFGKLSKAEKQAAAATAEAEAAAAAAAAGEPGTTGAFGQPSPTPEAGAGAGGA